MSLFSFFKFQCVRHRHTVYYFNVRGMYTLLVSSLYVTCMSHRHFYSQDRQLVCEATSHSMYVYGIVSLKIHYPIYIAI
jgi:hypothetical protein